MGEYYKNIKLGTMDDFRYVRLDEMQAEAEKTSELDCYLNDPTPMYRFPFPDEDGQSIEVANQRERERHFVFAQPDGMEISHQEKCVHVSANGGGWGVNVFIPCPAEAHKHGIKTSPVNTVPLEIVGERRDPATGKLRTIFSCSWCENWFSLDQESVELIRQTIIKYNSGEWYHQIASRLHANG
jgi:hypothetical protein